MQLLPYRLRRTLGIVIWTFFLICFCYWSHNSLMPQLNLVVLSLRRNWIDHVVSRTRILQSRSIVDSNLLFVSIKSSILKCQDAYFKNRVQGTNENRPSYNQISSGVTFLRQIEVFPETGKVLRSLSSSEFCRIFLLTTFYQLLSTSVWTMRANTVR
jgi:hypothetical protein